MSESLIVTTANVARKPIVVRRRYVRHLRKITRAHGRGVLCLQEVGHGTKSTRVRRIGVKASKQRWKIAGVGAHNGIAWRTVMLDGKRVRVHSAHGLHLRTVGRTRQRDYYADLAVIIRRLDARGIDWVLAGDFNRKHKVIARYLGGTSVGEGVDGVVVSAGLRVNLLHIDRWAVGNGSSDHPAVVARVTRRKS